IQWQKSARFQLPFVSGHIMFEALDRSPGLEAEWVAAIRRLVEILAPAYGEVLSMAVKGWDAPLNLRIRLPDIPSVSVYGPDYIKLFGKERIESAPFLAVEKVGACYWAIASGSPRLEVPAVLRKKIREHLSADAFMADGSWKYTGGIAPDFDLSNTTP